MAKAIGRADLLTDPRFSDPAKLVANMPQLTAILDEVFSAQPMAHWHEVFAGVHVTFGEVRGPQEVINDPQLRANDIVVPLDGAGGKLTSTISSPIQVHGVTKVPARRAPGLGEHTEEILERARLRRRADREPARERRRSEGKGTRGLDRAGTIEQGSNTMNDIITERSGSILRVELNRPTRRTR